MLIKVFRPPRGTRDIVYPSSVFFERVVETAKKIFTIHGFKPMYSPAFETLDLLRAKGGEEIEKQIYSFKDKSGRWLGLRFDHTIGLARYAAATRNLKLPFKRFTVGPVWRYEEVKSKVRWREFWQADVDILGVEGADADVECVAAVSAVFKELGLKNFTVKVNSRLILEKFFEQADLSKGQFLSVCRAIDKIGKKETEDVKKEMKKAGLTNELIEDFFGLEREMLTGKRDKLLLLADYMKKKGIKTEKDKSFNQLKKFFRLAQEAGLKEHLDIDITLARGLDYYTSLIFEFQLSGKEKISVAGGGRYDELIEQLGGKYTPATGLSIGITRLVSLMAREEQIQLQPTYKTVQVIPIKTTYKGQARRIVYTLRKHGIVADYDLKNRSFSTQLENTIKQGKDYAIFIGGKEIKEKKVKIKNLKTKEEQALNIEHIVRMIKETT